MMNIDTELNKLKNIRRVGAPPFLWTRIEQRISSASMDRVSRKFRLTVITSLLVVSIIDVLVISSVTVNNKEKSGIQNLASTMKLSSSNDLYE